eukprot:TRINITY_DN1909_c0_g1_i1.p1 TRINITY_DN1909_c0_g1~~TRINITY_DN1909_c0_g1_i1.p1  ORF type:complete len:300 (-),score=34.77 TRINITY_DN1909_c0_g1_i1:364-1218(-)
MFRLLVLALLGLSSVCGRRIDPIGPNFWNIRGNFDIDSINIGTHMSIIKLSSGKFLVVDTINITADLLQEFNTLTSNGTSVEAIVATHPFHTSFFPMWYKAFPHIPFYGTPRHLRIEPSIPWAGSMYDCAIRQKWLPDVHMRIPAGAEFVAPVPESDNHFSGIHVFHPLSKTIHVDDTINIGVPLAGDFLFHPSLIGPALFHVPGSPQAFKAWVLKYCAEWDFDNVVAAHKARQIGGAKAKVETLVKDTELLFDALNARFELFPNATQKDQWAAMRKHEAACEE